MQGKYAMLKPQLIYAPIRFFFTLMAGLLIDVNAHGQSPAFAICTTLVIVFSLLDIGFIYIAFSGFRMVTEI